MRGDYSGSAFEALRDIEIKALEEERQDEEQLNKIHDEYPRRRR